MSAAERRGGNFPTCTCPATEAFQCTYKPLTKATDMLFSLTTNIIALILSQFSAVSYCFSDKSAKNQIYNNWKKIAKLV